MHFNHICTVWFKFWHWEAHCGFTRHWVRVTGKVVRNHRNVTHVTKELTPAQRRWSCTMKPFHFPVLTKFLYFIFLCSIFFFNFLYVAKNDGFWKATSLTDVGCITIYYIHSLFCEPTYVKLLIYIWGRIKKLKWQLHIRMKKRKWNSHCFFCSFIDMALYARIIYMLTGLTGMRGRLLKSFSLFINFYADYKSSSNKNIFVIAL